MSQQNQWSQGSGSDRREDERKNRQGEKATPLPEKQAPGREQPRREQPKRK